MLPAASEKPSQMAEGSGGVGGGKRWRYLCWRQPEPTLDPSWGLALARAGGLECIGPNAEWEEVSEVSIGSVG